MSTPRKHPQSPSELEFQERDRFDMVYGTNTTTPLAKTGFHDIPNLAHGKAYMASWTSEIEKSFSLIHGVLGKAFPLYSFIDIGCGKGKVPIVWRLECQRLGLKQRIIGIDYYPPFIDLAQSNHHKVFGTPGEFICADAESINYGSLGSALITYLYNPFDDQIMNAALKALRRLPCIVIYNIPTHTDLLGQHGFELIHARGGKNQNQTTHIYANHPHRG